MSVHGRIPEMHYSYIHVVDVYLRQPKDVMQVHGQMPKVHVYL